MFSGNTLRQWSSKLIARDPVFRIMQRTLHASLTTRRAVERNAERVLSVLDVPSRRDVERIVADVEAIDATLASLQLRLDRLREAVEATETDRGA